MATTDKYDRQLRLWGADGQRALASAHVLCLGSSAVATEVLKNLVLPGVGAFTVVDDARVTSEDLSGNFFLEISDLGTPRASAVVPRLLELNPDVKGHFVISDPADFLKTVCSSPAQSGAPFSLVIAANAKDLPLEGVVEKFPASLEILSQGFLGSVRVFVKEHIVMEARAEERNFPDLRLRSPWPELQAFSDGVDLAAADEKTHGHIPWSILLLKAVQKIGNGNLEFPTVKAELMKMRRSAEEENFSEAAENVHVALHEPGNLSVETSEVFARLSELADRKFQRVGRAIKKFFDVHGCLPLSGKIPDMTADTETFLALQRVYLDKAERDFQETWKFLVEEGEFEDEAFARKLVKNAAELRVLRMIGNLQLEFPIEDEEDEAAVQGMRIYKALRGVEADGELKDEISRSKDAELHAVSAVLGGVAAQEATKILTRIFTPLDNLFVFNGVNGEGFTLRVG